FWCFIGFVNLFTERPESVGNFFTDYLAGLYTAEGVRHGGVLGGMLGDALRTLLGTVGAGIMLITAMTVMLMLLTGRSLVKAIRRVWKKSRTALQGAFEAKDNGEGDPSDLPRGGAKLKPLPTRVQKAQARQKKASIFDIDDDGEEAGGILSVGGDANNKDEKNKNEDNEKDGGDSSFEKRRGGPRPIIRGMADTEAEDARGVCKDGSDDDYDDNNDDENIDDALVRILNNDIDFNDEKNGADNIEREANEEQLYENYELPPVELLKTSPPVNMTGMIDQIDENSRILEETLKSFKVEAKVIEVSVGPTVTRYDMAPGPGVKVATIANLSNDLALSLAAQGIRIEAPIPGKSAVGIEIPNKDPQPVFLREILDTELFEKFPSKLAFAVGKDIAGDPVVADIARMPHLLIAGATGSGKSVCINTLIASILFKARPDEVKLLMIDPKVVELSVFNGIPHLLIPVVTDPKKASGALQWAVAEMDNRYNMFAESGAREIKSYNSTGENPYMPQIVIIIDELADLMMVCKGEVEEAICRLAQKARAAGIHLIVATQRPSVDVITGLIKANIPSRLAFAVSSGVDSRVVLDGYGAEKLLGKGDMLFLPMDKNKPVRLQGGYISDPEVEKLVTYLKEQATADYTPEMITKITAPGGAAITGDEDLDEFFSEAVEFLVEKGKASTSMLQRQFRIGYNRAARLMEELETRGIVGPDNGAKPRKVMITWEEYTANYKDKP
ncbi:MAG: DNA translocase FtsK, partial [Defluviitaleaceae bacterium]|nr:DNA translocase FtsK [Defluviitaleaceae bacterium]